LPFAFFSDGVKSAARDFRLRVFVPISMAYYLHFFHPSKEKGKIPHIRPVSGGFAFKIEQIKKGGRF
jgi:hypothetical protein